jgi:hypothetical protein
MPIPPDELALLLELVTVRHNMRDILAAAERDQLTPRPSLPDDAATLRACEELLARFNHGSAPVHIPDDAFAIPKWVFIEHALTRYGFVAHGSPNAAIDRFEPRVARDTLEGGDQPRVYAASSRRAAGFYAIVDRQRLDTLPVIPALINLYVPARNEQEQDHFLFRPP